MKHDDRMIFQFCGSDENTHVPERERFLSQPRRRGFERSPSWGSEEPSNAGSGKKIHVPATGTTGTPVPVGEEPKIPENPNKTTETPTLTGPEKNQSVPVPEEKEPTHLAKRHGVRTTPAAFPSNTNEPPKTTNASTTTTQTPPALSKPPLSPRLYVRSTREQRAALLNALEQEVAQIKSRLPQFRNKPEFPVPPWGGADLNDSTTHEAIS